MDLSLDPPGVPNYVRSVSASGIRIGEDTLSLPMLVTGDELYEDWPVENVTVLAEQHLDTIIALKPELVLLGTGTRQVFPHPRLLFRLQERGIGVEVMNTEAACRTYNVLASEGRKVLAALMPLDPD